MKVPLILLRINRNGEFIAQVGSDTPSQCGKPGARNYKYFVSIEASNKHLTPEGFVMENAWVDEYFQNTYAIIGRKCESCENMAEAAIVYFLNMFDRYAQLKNVDLRRILVRIHGSDFSFIEAEWTKKKL